MTNSYDSKFLDDPEFQSLLVACLESIQRGEMIDHEALVRDYPKYANEVEQFLKDRQLLEEVAADFGDVEPSKISIHAYEKTIASGSNSGDFAVGDSIRYIGEYEILEEIARGGMGIVFKARQQKLNRIVALKMVLAGKLADNSDVDRFQREAQAAGRLKHHNIVPVHEIGEHEGRHYFTMDFVEGDSLAEQIRGETLSPKAAARVVRTTANAVEYAHSQGTVHRDLKPANLIIDLNGEPQITDFGLAKMLDAVDEQSRAELTASGQILGTPSYMSPEQAAGKQELVGIASDVYSLGAILYASLTGRAPFVADSPVDTLLQVMNHDPVSPRTLNPQVPVDLETICLKCLEKEPHKRYASARELAEDLDRYLADRPIKARPADFSEKVTRWCRRNPAVASLLFLVFLSMAVGTAVSAYYASVANYRAQVALSSERRADNALKNEKKMREGAEKMSEFAMTQQSQAKSAREMAELETMRAKEQERLAVSALSRSLYEQANAIRLAGHEGHRWRALYLLDHAEIYRTRLADEPELSNEPEKAFFSKLDIHEMPKQWQLRSAAVATLLTQDARLKKNFTSIYQAVDPQEKFAALLEIAPGQTPIIMRLIEIASQTTIGELDLQLLAKEFVTPAFAISPEGKILASAQQSGIHLKDVKSGQTLTILKWSKEDKTNQKRTFIAQFHLEFSPNGDQFIAFGSGNGNGETLLWNLPDEGLSKRNDETQNPQEIDPEVLGTTRASVFASPCFSHDGTKVAYPVSQQQVVVDDLSGDEADIVIEIPKPMFPFGPLSFSDDDQSLALVTVSEKPRQSALVVWELNENKQLHKIMTSQNIWLTPPSLSPNKQYLAAGTPQGKITIFNLKNGQATKTLDHGGACRNVGWLSDTELWSTAAGGLKLWELSLKVPMREVKTMSPGDFASLRFMFSRDGTRLVTTTGRSEMHVYNWPDGIKLRTTKVPMRTTLDINLGKSGQKAVVTGMSDPTGTSAGLAQLGILPMTSAGIDLNTGEELFVKESRGSLAAGITNEGKIRFLSKEKNVLKVTDHETDQVIWSKTFDSRPGIEPVASISSDGRLVAVWKSSLMLPTKDSQVDVWEVATDQQLFSIKNESGPITGVEFSLNGKKLFTLHNDQILNGLTQSSRDAQGKAIVRNALTGEIETIINGSRVTAAAMSQDGSLIAVQFRSQQVEVWDTAKEEHLFNWMLPDMERTFVNNYDIEFTPDGQHLGAVVNSKGLLQFLDLDQVRKSLKPLELDW